MVDSFLFLMFFVATRFSRRSVGERTQLLED